MFLKPKPGLKVPDLMLRDFLPEEGRDVAPSEYWTRRLLDGDVVEASPEAPAPETVGPVQADAAASPEPAPVSNAEQPTPAAPEHEEPQL